MAQNSEGIPQNLAGDRDDILPCLATYDGRAPYLPLATEASFHGIPLDPRNLKKFVIEVLYKEAINVSEYLTLSLGFCCGSIKPREKDALY